MRYDRWRAGKDVTELNGFTLEARTNTTLSFVDATRTFTISPVSGGFSFYVEGLRYTKATSDSVVIDDTEGEVVIYYDGPALTALSNPTAGNIDTIIRTKCIVAILYWDATNNVSITPILDERHGAVMDGVTHSYLHFSRGAQYISGFDPDDIVADGDGSSNTHAQFSVDVGMIADEDLTSTSSAITSTTGYDIYYLLGANGDLRKLNKAGFPVIDDTTASAGTTTGRIVYNQFTGGAWQLTAVTNNDFVLCHVFAINSDDASKEVMVVMGQAEYATIVAARAGANTEIYNLRVALALPEIVPLYTFIFETKDSFSNDVKAVIRTDGDGNEYTDWRIDRDSVISSV